MNLVWYFYALAVEQGKSFIEGTFVIEDKNNLIFNSLENSTENYTRISSHFKDLNQFGIDIPEDKRENLFFPPYNPQKLLPKYTILFGQIKPELIFIKPESFGISALKDQLMHLVEYLEPRENEAKGMRKERVPKDIISAWNEFLITKFGAKESQSWIPKLISGSSKLPNYANIFIKTQKDNIQNTKEVNTSGIAQNGISAIREALEFAIEFQDNKLTEPQKTSKQKLLTLLDEAGKEKGRIGNEIILTDKELNEGLKECKI